MISTLREIWAAILTPSAPDEPAYDRLVISAAHAVLGAALAALFAPLTFAAALLCLALYWVGKERRDMRRGGSFRDSLWDTAAVALGLGYGAAWWPFAALLLALATALDRRP